MDDYRHLGSERTERPKERFLNAAQSASAALLVCIGTAGARSAMVFNHSSNDSLPAPTRVPVAGDWADGSYLHSFWLTICERSLSVTKDPSQGSACAHSMLSAAAKAIRSRSAMRSRRAELTMYRICRLPPVAIVVPVNASGTVVRGWIPE